MFDTQQCVTMACMLDVIAPKPGNVHRGADFDNMTFLDFAASAVAIGPIVGRASDQPVGLTILQSIEATRRVTQANTNLGIVLLLVPLAAASAADSPRDALRQILRSLSIDDAKHVYQAIRLAGAGGLGKVDEADVNDDTSPPVALLHSMELARDRDRIAELYVTNFDLIFDDIAPLLARMCAKYGILDGLIAAYVDVLSRLPDTLIRRKCGAQVAQEASSRAARCMNCEIGSDSWQDALSGLDFWLRSDRNRRNPGTTADLLTAGMFMALNEDQVNW